MADAVPDLAAFLAGRWHVERELRDGDRDGRFEGTATFTAEGGDLRWDETGELQLGEYRGPATRSLRLVAGSDGWEVRFDDGRPFHPLDLSSGRWEAGHDCGADRYDGEFDVLGPDALDIVWVVHGPAKAQRIVSRYRRV